jgi:site-specific recombinase XerD
MAHISPQTYTRAVPKGAEIVSCASGKAAKWVGRRGEEIVAPLCDKDPTRCRVTTSTLYVFYRDHKGRKRRSKAGRSMRTALKKKFAIEDQVERVHLGDISPASLNRGGRTLSALLIEWKSHLQGKERGSKHVRQTISRVEKIIDEIGAVRPGDITGEAVQGWLSDLRRKGENYRGEFTGSSAQTHNHYLSNTRSFVRWLIRRGYLDADPLLELDPLNADAARAFERRAMTDQEFWSLIETAAKSEIIRRNLPGIDRAMCYLAAGFTGLRLSELARLTPESFIQHGDQYRILLPAADQKNRKELPVFIPSKAANRLRPYLVTKSAGERMWNRGGWARNGQATWALYRDLEDAKVPILVDDKRLDFHSLRTHFQTSMLVKGIPVPHATRLARLSSPAVMMRFYAKLGLDDLAAEAEKLSGSPATRSAQDRKRPGRKK